MVELKTQRTKASVAAFLKAVPDTERRKECQAIAAMLRKATGKAPAMWGPSIVGFGHMNLRYATGRELEWFEAGFSPRKGNLTLYLNSGFKGHQALLRKLGKHKTSVSCLYFKRLADLDLTVLRELVDRSVAEVRKRRT